MIDASLIIVMLLAPGLYGYHALIEIHLFLSALIVWKLQKSRALSIDQVHSVLFIEMYLMHIQLG
jgi:hypothetical protein